jgi:hypothetical protein
LSTGSLKTEYAATLAGVLHEETDVLEHLVELAARLGVVEQIRDDAAFLRVLGQRVGDLAQRGEHVPRRLAAEFDRAGRHRLPGTGSDFDVSAAERARRADREPRVARQRHGFAQCADHEDRQGAVRRLVTDRIDHSHTIALHEHRVADLKVVDVGEADLYRLALAEKRQRPDRHRGDPEQAQAPEEGSADEEVAGHGFAS